MYHFKVEICGINTSELKVLTEEEKTELLRRTREGDEEARKELIYGNLRLVLSIIQRFSGRRESMEDLFQVGCIGLVKAVDHFNMDMDVKFSTYAVPMIIGEIRRYLRDNNAIRVSRSVRELAYRALQTREELIAVKEREPTVEEIAETSPTCSMIVANASGKTMAMALTILPQSGLERSGNTVFSHLTGRPIHAAFATAS